MVNLLGLFLFPGKMKTYILYNNKPGNLLVATGRPHFTNSRLWAHDILEHPVTPDPNPYTDELMALGAMRAYLEESSYLKKRGNIFSLLVRQAEVFNDFHLLPEDPEVHITKGEELFKARFQNYKKVMEILPRKIVKACVEVAQKFKNVGPVARLDINFDAYTVEWLRL